MLPRLILCLSAMFPLTACLSDTVYHAEGVSVGARDNQIAICDSDALAQYPVRNETRFRPPVFVPPTETCDSEGTCTTTPGYYEPPEPYIVDVNQTFRRTAFRGCMGAAGFNRIDLPFCERGSAVTQSTVMPGLTGGTCLLRRGPGDPLVVNPVSFAGG